MPHLEFNNHFLNQIIFHGIQNDEFLKCIRYKVPVDIFKSKEKQILVKLIYDFFDEYKTAPKDNFFDIFKDYENTMSTEVYNRCIDLIGVLKDITGSNWQYILNNIINAINHFQLEEAGIEFANLLKQQKHDDAKQIILETIRKQNIENTISHYDYFKDVSFIEERIKKEYKMRTLISRLDALIGGLREGWLITLLGATKAGKTWWLIELAIAALLQGLNVTFISIEMGKMQIDERFDMAIGFLASTIDGFVDLLQQTNNGTWIQTRKKVDTIYNINTVLKNRRTFKKTGNGGLRIIASNRGRLNYLDIGHSLTELEETEGFFTDLLVVDYLGIMKKINASQTKKEGITENCLGLKEIASTRNLIALSGMQGNRKAMTSKVFHSYMVADDIDTIFNSDLILAICQTALEEKLNKSRIYVANYRHGPQHGSVGVIRNLAIGQAALDTYEIKEEEETEEDSKITGINY